MVALVARKVNGHGGFQFSALMREDPYRLQKLIGEADALRSLRPNSKTMLDACCVVRGYVELYPHYGKKAFPWGHVQGIVKSMRKAICDGTAYRRGIQTPVKEN